MVEFKRYELDIKFDINQVLQMSECSIKDPNYSSYKVKLEGLLDMYLSTIKPVGYVLYTKEDDIEKLYSLVTIGDAIDKVVAQCFKSYDFLAGMMLNVLGDTILFESTNLLYDILKEEVSNNKRFLSVRYEPGTSQTPMEMQKGIYDKVIPYITEEITITEGYMLSPSKSMTYFYNLSLENCSLGIDHDCSLCDLINCKMRKSIVTVIEGEKMTKIQAGKGENLLSVLRMNDVFVNAQCSGKKLCGKCKVILVDGDIEYSDSERKFLSDEEIQEGVILACFHEVVDNITVKVKDVTATEIVSEFEL